MAPATVRPGDFVHIPAGRAQRIRNTGALDLIFYALCALGAAACTFIRHPAVTSSDPSPAQPSPAQPSPVQSSSALRDPMVNARPPEPPPRDPISEVLHRYDPPLWLITARHAGRRGGLIATFAVRASIVSELPRMAVGIAKHHHT